MFRTPRLSSLRDTGCVICDNVYYVLTPGRYVGILDEEDDGILFEEKIAALTAELKAQMQEAESLDREIVTQLAKIGIIL